MPLQEERQAGSLCSCVCLLLSVFVTESQSAGTVPAPSLPPPPTIIPGGFDEGRENGKLLVHIVVPSVFLPHSRPERQTMRAAARPALSPVHYRYAALRMTVCTPQSSTGHTRGVFCALERLLSGHTAVVSAPRRRVLSLHDRASPTISRRLAQKHVCAPHQPCPRGRTRLHCSAPEEGWSSPLQPLLHLRPLAHFRTLVWPAHPFFSVPTLVQTLRVAAFISLAIAGTVFALCAFDSLLLRLLLSR